MGRNRIELAGNYLEIITKLSSLGCSRQNIADALGISLSTFERRIDEDSDIKKAMRKGKGRAIEEVANTAFKMATDGKHPQMTMFWLKTNKWGEESQESDDTFTFMGREHNIYETLKDVEND